MLWTTFSLTQGGATVPERRVDNPHLAGGGGVCPTAIGDCKGGTRGNVGAPLISLLTVTSSCLIPGGRGGLDGRPLAVGNHPNPKNTANHLTAGKAEIPDLGVCPTAIGYCKGGTRGKVGAPLISLLTVMPLCLIPGGRGGLGGRPLAAGKTEIE